MAAMVLGNNNPISVTRRSPKPRAVNRRAMKTCIRLLACCAVVLAALAFAATSARAQTADPINGGVTLIGATKCPNGGVGNSLCYSISIQCSGMDVSGVAAIPATIKVTNAASAKGAIIFVSPGGGNSYYDQSFAYGDLVVNSVVQAGYTAVQPFFGGLNGWLTGPAPDGPRALACRFAALANWVATTATVHQSGTAMCAAGVSGGSSAIAYALAHFGMGTGASRLFDMTEVTSGPTFSHIDHGCICASPPYQTTTGQGPLSDCYLTIGSLIDDTYPSNVCSQARVTHSTSNQELFIHDSIMSDDQPFLNYTTAVHVTFGAQNDEGSGIPQGLEWANSITSPVTVKVVPDAAHLLPDSFDGALQVASDLMSGCVLQNPKQ